MENSDLKIQLVDSNKEMCDAWNLAFKDCSNITIFNGDFFALPTDCVVSPANSFGFMNGGLDLAISDTLGWDVQGKLQQIIKEKYFGELLVGQAELIETSNKNIPYCISAPTMRVPLTLSNSVNVYLAAKAIFQLLQSNPQIKTVTISGLGTGVGMVPFDICANQMKKAYDDIWLGLIEFPNTLYQAKQEHCKLFSHTFL